MNGPEHYREAERLLGGLVEKANELNSSGLRAEISIAQLLFNTLRANAHATLALAAATANAEGDALAWARATTVVGDESVPA